MLSEQWNEFKARIATRKILIKEANAGYHELLSQCTCEEQVHKVNKGHIRGQGNTETHFDECVVCMKMYNGRTKRV